MAREHRQQAARIADEIRAGLRASAQPEKADGMQAYLKSELPCLGTYSKDRRRAVNDALDDVALSEDLWRALIDELWDDPEVREERHAAIDVLTGRPAREHRTPDVLKLCRNMAVEGGWWDLVDGIGVAVNDIVTRHREEATPTIRRWATDEDLWVRRLAITAQLRSKEDTDVDLLTHAIDANIGSQEFFLRKAIGWALRTYAKSDPEWVRRFVAKRSRRLSALSLREATKHL